MIVRKYKNRDIHNTYIHTHATPLRSLTPPISVRRFLNAGNFLGLL